MSDEPIQEAQGGDEVTLPARISGNFDRFNFVNATMNTPVGAVQCMLFDQMGNLCDSPITTAGVGPGTVFMDPTIYGCGVVKIICEADVNGTPQHYEIDVAVEPYITMATFGITEDMYGNLYPIGLIRREGGIFETLQAVNMP